MDIARENKLIQKIWDYSHMNHSLRKSGCILVMGNHDTRTAERGAQLYLEGYAPLIVFSGYLGNLTKGMWTIPEAEVFADVAMKMGVPSEKILIENRSTNTGENVIFTKNLLDEKGIDPKDFILVHKPYMERRAYATFRRYWPEKDALITSPQLKFEEYLTEEITRELVVNTMLGDLQRLKLYPEKGYTIYQHIPDDVWEAFLILAAAGYDKGLIK